MSSVTFLLFHNLDFEAACFRGFSWKACGLSCARSLLRPHAFQDFPGKHAGCHLHAVAFSASAPFEAACFPGISSKACGLKWSCIEIDSRCLYPRSPSIHMRCPYIIGRDSWVWDISLCWPDLSPHEVGVCSHSVMIITIIISLRV